METIGQKGSIGLVSATLFGLGGIIVLVVFAGLLIQIAVHVGHLWLIDETSARRWLIVLAVVSLVVISIMFAISTVQENPESAVIIGLFTVAALLFEFGLRRYQGRTLTPGTVKRPEVIGGHE